MYQKKLNKENADIKSIFPLRKDNKSNEMQEAMTAAVATGQSSFTYTTPVLSTAKAYSLEFSCIQSDADLAWHAFRGMAEQLGMRVFENYPKTVIQPSTSTLETYAVVLDRDANGNANLGIVNRSINNGSYKKLTNTYQLGELAQITYKFSIQK